MNLPLVSFQKSFYCFQKNQSTFSLEILRSSASLNCSVNVLLTGFSASYPFAGQYLGKIGNVSWHNDFSLLKTVTFQVLPSSENLEYCDLVLTNFLNCKPGNISKATIQLVLNPNDCMESPQIKQILSLQNNLNLLNQSSARIKIFKALQLITKNLANGEISLEGQIYTTQFRIDTSQEISILSTIGYKAIYRAITLNRIQPPFSQAEAQYEYENFTIILTLRSLEPVKDNEYQLHLGAFLIDG